jgi:LPS-assembly lipoprotein
MFRPCKAAGAADADGIGKPANAAGAEQRRGADPTGVLKRALRVGIGRRGLLGAVALGLGGCGFRPLHAPRGADPALASELAAVRVPVIAERFGQLTRRGLQQKLAAGAPGPVTPRYELRLVPALSYEGSAIDLTGAATRVRMVAGATWALLGIGPPVTVLATGFERATEAYNVPTTQYFSADLGREAAERRLAEALVDEVVLRVSLAMRRRLEGVAPPVDPAAVPAPGPVPLPLPEDPLSSLRQG